MHFRRFWWAPGPEPEKGADSWPALRKVLASLEQLETSRHLGQENERTSVSRERDICSRARVPEADPVIERRQTSMPPARHQD
jgi:hypothetical protein